MVFSGSIVYFHIWKMSYAKWKNSKNIEKNQKKVVMAGDGVGWCFQGPVYISYIECEAVLNVRTGKIYGKNIRKN